MLAKIQSRSLFVLIYLLLLSPGLALAQGIVTGLVTASGAPVTNARVTLYTPLRFYETRTIVDGTYSISNVRVGAGQQRLGVAAPGYDYQERLIKTSAGTYGRDFALLPESHPGRWEVIGNTLPEFLDATDIAVLSADGRIFYCHDTQDPVLFDPVTGQKTFPTGFEMASGCMNGTLLGDGRILFVGGQEGSEPGSFRLAVPWVRTHSLLSNSWTRLPDVQLAVGRWYPGLARLSDGSLLVMGGGTRPDAVRTATCERFDLATQTWSYTGSMLNPSEFSPSALLYTGEVLITWSPPQLYNPTTGQWRLTGSFNQPNRGWPGHSDHSLVVLADGRALALGVRRGASQNSMMGEIYDPATGTWSVTSNPDLIRFQTEMVALPDGKILVAGGETEQTPPPVPNVLGIVKWSDLYNPISNTWRRVADMNHFREYHAVTLLLPDGRVATTGGTRIKFQVGPTSADIEAFVPPYLLRGVRPRITDISTTSPARGSQIQLTIAPQTRLTNVVLIGTGTTTHWVDGGIPRRMVLPVSQKGSTVTITLPTDPNILPLGHYMLFAMVDDIPSVARIVNVRPAAGSNYNETNDNTSEIAHQ